MNLEQGKRYLTRSGMITPPLNLRHGGISFDLPDTGDVGDVSSGIRWLPDGRCETAGISSMVSDEFDLVAEVQIVLLGEQVYRGCKIEPGEPFGWNWFHEAYDGAPDAFGEDSEGYGIRDNRHGRCSNVCDCVTEIDEMFEDGGMER